MEIVTRACAEEFGADISARAELSALFGAGDAQLLHL
jgi:hypothetical protein